VIEQTTVPAVVAGGTENPNPRRVGDLVAGAQATADDVVQRLVTVGREIAVDLPDDTEALWGLAVEMENAAAQMAARQGLVYLALKQRVGHGGWYEALAERGLSNQRAGECIRIAQMLLALPEATRARVALLPKRQLIPLASLDPEVLDQAVEQGELDLDDEALMRPAELRRRVRALKLELARKDLDVEAAEMAAEQAREDADAVLGRTRHQWPASVVRARLEGGALADRALAAIDGLDHLVQALYQATDLPTEPETAAEAAMGAGASTLYLHLRAVGAKVARVLAVTRAMYPEHMLPEDAASDPTMSEAESKELFARRALMLLEERADAEAREQARLSAGEIRRGRGRPKAAAPVPPRSTRR
jgi:hypothetical protein